MKKLFILSIYIVLILAAPLAHAKALKVAFDSDPESMDPHEQISEGTLQMSHWIFDPLVRWDNNMKLEPRLVEKWERISDNTIRFTLRQGVKFHSGNPLTSKDVEWTFNRIKTSGDFKSLFDAFEKINIIDDFTFEIITNKPYALVLNQCTYIFPMDRLFYSGTDEKGRPKEAIIKHVGSFASRNASGTGPYRLIYREQGVRLELERFADYWDKTEPGNVTKITLTPIKEAATRVAALLSGDVDVIAQLPPNDFERINQNQNLSVLMINGTRIITLQLNQKRRTEFQNKKVRQAIVHAINNAGIVEKIMKGFATVATQQSPKEYAGHNPELDLRFDLDKAKQLMKEAGYENGFSVTMMTPNDRYMNDAKIAEAVVAMLAKINIRVDLKTLPKAQYWPQFDARAADIMMIGWHSDTEDSANFTEYLLMTSNPESGYGQYNSGNYSNPEVDQLVLSTQTMLDEIKRSEILKKVEHILYDDAAFVPLHWQNYAWAAKQGIGIGSIINVTNFPYFGDLIVN